MNTSERAFERLVTANPVPDPERAIAIDADFGVVLRDMDEVMMDTRTNDEGKPARTAVPRRGWLVTTAAFIAVLAVGGALAFATMGNDDRNAAVDTPTNVVDAFFQRWNDGNAVAAMALIDPAIRINGGVQGVNDLRGLVEFAIEFDGSMETECAADVTPGRVTCNWAWVTAGTAALGLPDWADRSLTVVDGMITALTTPDYGALEVPLGEFAQAEDPGGFAQECRPDGVSPLGALGYPFNQRCGRFLADMEGAFIASLED